MNQVRTFLLFAWLLVGFLLWEAWQTDYAAPSVSPAPTERSELSDDLYADAAIPSATPVESDPSTPLIGEERADAPASVELVSVQTDLLRLQIDPRGATVVHAELLAYGETADKGSDPVFLLSTERGHFFTAQSGWVNAAGNAPNHQVAFRSEQSEYRLHGGQDELRVPFHWTGENGLTLHRELVLRRGSYAVEVVDTLQNQGSEPWQGTAYRQLLREPPITQTSKGFTNPESYSFIGAAWFSPTDKFNKITFDDFDPKQPLKTSASGAWVAMLQHYFFAAWIPAASEKVQLSTSEVRGKYLIRALSPTTTVEAGSQASSSAQLYIGPKLQDQLATVAPGLERTIDYGIFTVIAEPLFWLLSLFHGLTGNWGWAIILLVLLIKAVFFKLSETQYKSFAKMRMVQPRIESLKERYGDDKQKFNMAMMELYKKEKINPMGGCLPILVQIPVFISLYWVLLESVELRHAPWMGWIQNLTAPDPYFILPVLNLSTMWLTQKLSPTPGMDPLQKKMMQAMPLVFGVMFAFFPAGLVLYWTVNGGLGLLQQWVITKRHGTPQKA